MDGEPLDSLVRRLERLERENRRLRRIGSLALLGLAALGLLGQFRPSHITPVVEAERFVLRHRSGKIRAELSVLADVATTLTLSDESGKLRVALTAGPAGGASGSAPGGAGLTLFAADGRARVAALGAGLGETGTLTLADRTGAVTWKAP